MHWIDPTSLELLDILLDAITDQPVMILATARPGFEHGFGGQPIVTRFALNRLGKDQISGIVFKLTDGKTLPDEIMEIIAQRTDGVPLFVEELTKTILESGVVKEDSGRLVLNGPLSAIAIPSTLHDSLMARLDRLQPIKEVAQTAACIGREFGHGLLLQISHLSDAELSTALDGLIAAELIYRRGLPPEATYVFKHALVRDAAYESLLKEKRRTVHTRILSALGTNADIAPEILAVHAESANLTDRAIDLWKAAGKAAIALPAFDEAISHLGRAIALITPQLENSDTPPFERALALQIPLNTAPRVVANRAAGHSHFFMGNFAEAQGYLDVALTNYDPVTHAGLANQFGLDVGVTVHSFQAFNLLMLGQSRRAATHIELSESLVNSTGHIQTICTTLFQRATSYSMVSGDFSDFERCQNKLTPIAQEHSLTQWTIVTSVMAELLAAHKGDKSSIARYRKADVAMVAAKNKLGLPNYRVNIARSALAMGLRKEAVELAMMAQEMIYETGEAYALSDLHRLQAAIAVAGGDTEAAERCLVTGLDVARRQGSKLWELRVAIDLAHVWQEQGRIDEAVALLEPVHNSIAEGNCPDDCAIAQTILNALTVE